MVNITVFIEIVVKGFRKILVQEAMHEDANLDFINIKNIESV